METSHSPLRRYRQSANLTLEEFGGRFGVNKSTVQRWEDGRVPAERVLDVERSTGVPCHELRPDLYPAPANPRAAE